jgi:hypothetical protein
MINPLITTLIYAPYRRRVLYMMHMCTVCCASRARREQLRASYRRRNGRRYDSQFSDETEMNTVHRRSVHTHTHVCMNLQKHLCTC